MNIPDDWESLVNVAREITADMDNRRWLLGDLAGLAERRHGQGSIKELATAIRMPRHKTLYEYERVARFYDLSTRGEFPLLSWSHYREAMRLGSPENARALLMQANDEDRPVAWLAREVKKRCGEKITPEKLMDAIGVITERRGDIVTFRFPAGSARALRRDMPVRIALWITDEQAPSNRKPYILGAGDRSRRIG